MKKDDLTLSEIKESANTLMYWNKEKLSPEHMLAKLISALAVQMEEHARVLNNHARAINDRNAQAGPNSIFDMVFGSKR